MSLFVTPGFASSVSLGGKSVQIADTHLTGSGGIIVNPLLYLEQKLPVAEVLYVSITGPAALATNNTTTELAPGQKFIVPPGCNVWVNAATGGHTFSAIFARQYVTPSPPIPVPGAPGSGVGIGGLGHPFPVDHPTGLTTVIPSYLYQEYSDDDDLQGFVESQNIMQQDYVDTFNALNLPIYPGPIVAGKLLDWVGQGVYGMARPSIGVGRPVQVGPLNTWAPADGQILSEGNPTDNLPAINQLLQVSIGNVVVTGDDLYRRILTWHFFKGDGKYFDTRWFKRRVWRFIMGENGVALEQKDNWFIADTEQISVSLGVERNVTTRFVLGKRTVTGGAMLNRWGPNGFGIPFGLGAPAKQVDIQLNDVESMYSPYPPLPYMSTFKESLDSGVLETPYQFRFTCTIG
jgi:hypothetical protein